MEFVYIILHLHTTCIHTSHARVFVHIYLYTWPLLLSVWPSLPFYVQQNRGPYLGFHWVFLRLEISKGGGLWKWEGWLVSGWHHQRFEDSWQPRMAFGFLLRVFKLTWCWMHAPGWGGVTWCCWFLLFVRKNDFDMCLCLKIFRLWSGGTHSTWDS